MILTLAKDIQGDSMTFTDNSSRNFLKKEEMMLIHFLNLLVCVIEVY